MVRAARLGRRLVPFLLPSKQFNPVSAAAVGKMMNCIVLRANPAYVLLRIFLDGTSQ